jgi:hypothetical protein
MKSSVFLPGALILATALTPGCSKVKLISRNRVIASAPKIISIVPPHGLAGTLITIHGTGFKPGVEVRLYGVLCSGLSYVSSEQLTCTTPGPHAPGAVLVRLDNPDNQFDELANGWTYDGTAIPGYAVTAGGGVASAAGIKVQAAIGQVTAPLSGYSTVQTAPGLNAIGNLQGVTYEP